MSCRTLTGQGRLFLAFSLAAVALGSGGAARGADPADNAALAYWRAWTLMTPEFQSHIPGGAGDSDFQPSDEARERLLSSEADMIAGELMKAASRPYCDFAGERSDGPHMLLPHLGPSRRAATFMAARARILLDDGRVEEAGRHIAAGYSLARHMGGDRVYISSLVSLSNFSTIDRVGAYAEAGGLLDVEARGAIAATLRLFDREDPFNHRAAIRGERDMTVRWFRNLGAEDLEESMMKLFGERSEQLPIDEKSFRVAIDALDLYYVSVEAAWFGEGAEENLGELYKRAQDGAFGPLAQNMAPYLSGMHRQYRTARDEVFPEALERVGAR